MIVLKYWSFIIRLTTMYTVDGVHINNMTVIFLFCFEWVFFVVVVVVVAAVECHLKCTCQDHSYCISIFKAKLREFVPWETQGLWGLRGDQTHLCGLTSYHPCQHLQYFYTLPQLPLQIPFLSKTETFKPF